MSQPQSPTSPAFLKTLYGAATLAALTHGPAAAAQAGGLLARGPVRITAALALVALAAVAVLAILVKRAARRADPNELDPASELTTLTFPPSRNARPRMHRAK